MFLKYILYESKGFSFLTSFDTENLLFLKHPDIFQVKSKNKQV